MFVLSQSMHAHFKKCYNITNERTVFHGTSRASADSITKTGFRGAVCQRAKFGKGIYTSSSVWEALAYAEPAEGDLTQTVLAVKLLQGPTTMGRQDMADFGTDEHGRCATEVCDCPLDCQSTETRCALRCECRDGREGDSPYAICVKQRTP